MQRDGCTIIEKCSLASIPVYISFTRSRPSNTLLSEKTPEGYCHSNVPFGLHMPLGSKEILSN